jgi:hypothetical protein
MIFSAIGFMIVENLSFVDSIYFTVVTVSTVGYGDIHPTTLPGKLLATILILGGIGAFVGVFTTLTEFLLSRKDSEIRSKKRNLVTGIFFSQVGDWLIHEISLNNPRIDELNKVVCIPNSWSPKDFEMAINNVNDDDVIVNVREADLYGWRNFLNQKTDTLLRLIENPSLLEQEAFTELLMAVMHLGQELSHRLEAPTLSEEDYAHITIDAQRVYRGLVRQWLSYMNHLKTHYPYLFALAINKIPFYAVSRFA